VGVDVYIRMNVGIYIYVCKIHVYIRMYIYTYIYTYVHIYTNVYVYIYLYICTYIFVCVDEAGSLMLVFVSGFGCSTSVWGGYD